MTTTATEPLRTTVERYVRSIGSEVNLLTARTNKHSVGSCYRNLASPIERLLEYYGEQIESNLPESAKGDTGQIEQLKYIAECARNIDADAQAINQRMINFCTMTVKWYNMELYALPSLLPMEGYKDAALGI